MNGPGEVGTVTSTVGPRLPGLTQWRLLGLWTLLLGGLFALTEDEQSGGLFSSLLYWWLHIGFGLLLCALASHWLLQRPALRGRPWILLSLAGLLGAIAFSPVALLLEAAFALLGYGEADLLDEPRQAFLPLLLDEALSLAPPFLLSWLLLMTSYQWMQRPLAAEASASAGIDQGDSPASPEPVVVDANPQPEAEGLLALLPAALGSEVLHLESDLNYLHVVTRAGRGMVLYSLRLAVEELGQLGIQVHRSHWVSRSAIQRVRRQRQGLVIELVTGETVPVARRRQAVVRAEFGDRFDRMEASEDAS